MYRAYNGQLYGAGAATDGNKQKVHPNDVVKIEWDADEGTLSYFVNEAPQGVCFRGLKGKTLYPAACCA